MKTFNWNNNAWEMPVYNKYFYQTYIPNSTFNINSNILTSIYPNPTNDILYFDLETDNNVSIYTVNGQLISHLILKKGKQNLPVSNLMPGNYLINFEHEYKTFMFTKK
jgi:WD40 repeat protein